jgi:hypothetical protein
MMMMMMDTFMSSVATKFNGHHRPDKRIHIRGIRNFQTGPLALSIKVEGTNVN